jgi:hypothetical protein
MGHSLVLLWTTMSAGGGPPGSASLLLSVIRVPSE